MILGIGVDIIENSRFSDYLDNRKVNKLERIFTVSEIEYANSKNIVDQKAAVLAKRFAAKEALSKAVGEGIGNNIFLNEIEVIKDDKGSPSIKLNGRTKNFLDDKFNSKYSIFLSLSDEKNYSIAFVTISKI